MGHGAIFMEKLTIGLFAKKAGVNIETIRYYERKGLLPEPKRRKSGYRIYSAEDIRRIEFIIRAKSLGFTLVEIKEILDLYKNPETKCEDMKKKAENKIEDIERKISSLTKIKKALKKLSKQCIGPVPLDQCSIIDFLSGQK